MKRPIPQPDLAVLDPRSGAPPRAGADTAQAPRRQREDTDQTQHPRGTARRRVAASVTAALLAVACATTAPGAGPRDLLAAAVAARGGPITGFLRESRVRVHYGLPGSWRWELAYTAPDRLRLTLPSSAGDQSYRARGGVLRSSVGGAPVAEQPLEGTCHERLTGWMGLVWLIEPGSLRGRALATEALPPGATRGVAVECEALPGVRWSLYVDGEGLLVGARGPVEMPGIGRVELEVRLGAYRTHDGLRLPSEIDYRLDGQPFFEERVERWEVERRPAPEGSA